MPDLFRRQAIDQQRQKFHGAIVLTRSPQQAAWTVFFVLLVLALIAFAATQGFARQETVSGVLLPSGGVLRLVAPQAGVVLPGGVAQGQPVAANAPVLRLSAEQSSATGPTQSAVADSLTSRQRALLDELKQQAEQARQQAAALDARITNLDAALQQHERELALQRERIAVMQDIAARYPELVRSGAVSPVEVAEKNAEVLDQRARLSTLERQRLALQQDLASARAQRQAVPLQAEREGSQLRREAQALSQQQAENEARRETAVLAPQAGRIGTVLASPGQSVAAGQLLATLLPGGSGSALEAELEVPTRAAGFVKPGTSVKLRVDAFPYARFGQLPAHVREVSQSAVAMAPTDDTPAANSGANPGNGSGNGVYRVRVVIDATDGAALAWRDSLKAGMRVQASLVAEKRTLVEWVLEPLAGLQVAAR
ncbi:HlyD family secretion protein [Rhizobacter sp. P5_C2]